MTAALDLRTLPGSGRETAEYGTPRWPMRSPLPSLDPDDYDDGADGVRSAMLDLAANALLHIDDRKSLSESTPHVEALCHLVERLDVTGRALLLAEQERSNDLHAKLIARDSENLALRRELVQLRFELATRAVTGRSFAAQNTALDSDLETHVVDVDGLTGPVPDRTPTLQDVPATMAEVVGGGA